MRMGSGAGSNDKTTATTIRDERCKLKRGGQERLTFIQVLFRLFSPLDVFELARTMPAPLPLALEIPLSTLCVATVTSTTPGVTSRESELRF